MAASPPGGPWPPGPGNRLGVWLFHKIVGAGVRWYFRMRVENPPRIRGPYVLCPNHTSYLDPILLSAACPRRIRYLMNAVVYRSPKTGWFFRWQRAVPLALVNGNRDALKVARETLRGGCPMGIFPEGGISRDGLPILGQPGAVSLVLSEQVPVIPVGIVGACDALPFDGSKVRRERVTVRFGEPILPEEFAAMGGGRKERLAAATVRIMDGIAALTGHRSRESVLAEAG